MHNQPEMVRNQNCLSFIFFLQSAYSSVTTTFALETASKHCQEIMGMSFVWGCNLPPRPAYMCFLQENYKEAECTIHVFLS